MTAPAQQKPDEPDFNARYLPPPLREAPDDTKEDPKRVLWAAERWETQDAAYRLRDRDIEENCRILAGQYWWVYHHLLGWQDISHWMTDEEKRWRQRPVFHRILPWYILTHARMTENPFTCGYLPGPDQKDAELAEKLDVLTKLKWRDTGMFDVWTRTASWMIAAGTAFIYTRLDLERGEWEDWVGRAQLPLIGPDDQPVMNERDGGPVLVDVDGVPFDKEGKPLAVLRHDGLQKLGEPHRERTGDIVVEPLSPLEVRGQWGPRPWHEQKIHMIRSYLTPQEVWERWHIQVEPDITELPSGNAGFMERLLFGSGLYGSSSTPMSPYVTGATSATQADGYALVQTTFLAPSRLSPGMEEDRDKPGGRMLITTKSKVLEDGPRPVKWKWTSPIRAYEFLRLPGRPWGSTPLEVLKSPGKAYNQGWKQILENRALASNPQQVYDLDSGLRADQIDNKPGRQYGVRRRKQGIPPIEWIRPPELGSTVWRAQQMLQQEMSFLGSQQGMDAAQRLSPRASAKMIQELRFEDDRFLGPTMRRCAEESGRMVEDWRAYYPIIYSAETVLRYTGEDDAARTVILLPEIFREGQADVVPDIESMLPEGRGERRARDYQMWKDGAFGDPKDSGARRILFERLRYGSAAMHLIPGGIHIAAAKQENMAMLEGREPVIHEWQDHEVHLDSHETFMASPEWERLPDEVKALFIQHRWDTMTAMVQKRRQMLALAQMSSLPAEVPGVTPPPMLLAGAEASPGAPPAEPTAPGAEMPAGMPA